MGVFLGFFHREAHPQGGPCWGGWAWSLWVGVAMGEGHYGWSPPTHSPSHPVTQYWCSISGLADRPARTPHTRPQTPPNGPDWGPTGGGWARPISARSHPPHAHPNSAQSDPPNHRANALWSPIAKCTMGERQNEAHRHPPFFTNRDHQNRPCAGPVLLN